MKEGELKIHMCACFSWTRVTGRKIKIVVCVGEANSGVKAAGLQWDWFFQCDFIELGTGIVSMFWQNQKIEFTTNPKIDFQQKQIKKCIWAKQNKCGLMSVFISND